MDDDVSICQPDKLDTNVPPEQAFNQTKILRLSYHENNTTASEYKKCSHTLVHA
jgi:hypothetical protein